MDFMASFSGTVRTARARDFTTRFGYAPDMIDACSHCFVIYDPLIALDAMHALGHDTARARLRAGRR